MKDPIIHAQNKTEGFDLAVSLSIIINDLLYSTLYITHSILRKIPLGIKYEHPNSDLLPS